jgi:DNA gyrase/topoisomerase IV subunit A
MKQVVEENFERYAGNVILDRAICDVRDMLKPSARMLIYSQMSITKNTHKKPFIKSARVVGDCLGHLYEHGDASCYKAYMRMSKPFAMRVPLEECQGNNGTMISNGDEASMRYTELRLGEISSYLYNGLNQNAIGSQWRKNFDETEDYPAVMPSIGYFNICNGTLGLGIAISSSIPQFNLRLASCILSLALVLDDDFLHLHTQFLFHN